MINKNIIEYKENKLIIYIISKNNCIIHTNSFFLNNIIRKYRTVDAFKMSGFWLEIILK